ncbi:MAG TPA: hypothetical protein DCR90_02270 [Fusobacteriaceae bacterium]|nr:hypothetical protein [Fusobacteriaceae bacterium]
MTENKTIGIAGIIIATIYGVAAFGLKNPSPSLLIGPTIFPMIITVGTFFFSLVLIAEDYTKNAKKKVIKYDPKVLKAMGMYTGVFAIYILIFEKVGFLISTILMLTSLLFILNKGKSQYKINLILGFLFPLICYIIFAKIFTISLPRGILTF